jgi:hypothetical protein
MPINNGIITHPEPTTARLPEGVATKLRNAGATNKRVRIQQERERVENQVVNVIDYQPTEHYQRGSRGRR